MSKIRSLYYLKAIGYDFNDEFLAFKQDSSSFEELKNNVKNCTLCYFSKKRKHSLIESDFKKAKLMVLSTHASDIENKNGKVFSSTKMQNLKNYLKENLKLGEKEIYFSYLFKCFSSGKNDDFSLQSCLPFFFDEFELIKPKILLCLGEYSLKALGFENFSTLKGEIFSYKNSFILPSFELDFLERNPSYRQDFIEDLKKIKGFL